MNNAKNLTFESFMQEKFMDLGDLCGIPITKDNCEDLFEMWLERKDLADIMEYAEEYGERIYKEIK